MNWQKIHKGFVSYRFTLILTLLVFVVLRLSGQGDWLSVSLWGSLIIQVAIALFLMHITQEFGIIRYKTLLPAFFYLLLAGTNPVFFDNLTGSVSCMIVVLCLYFLFSSYQNPLSQANAFNISLLLTLGSFYWFPILSFFPLLWYGMYRFRSLNFRTFFASLMGFALIYLFLFTWSVYKEDWTIFINALPDFRILGNSRLFSFETKEWIMSGWLMLLVILSGVKIFMAGVSEKVQSITALGYLYFLSFFVAALFLVQNQWAKEWLPILYLPLSILYAHYFTLSYQRGVAWLFLMTIGLFLALPYV